MFRPFLPCGIAYGSAYGIPCSFSGGRHPAGLFVLYHIGAVLVNRFRQNFGGICLFPAPGVPPCRGGIAPALQARRALAVPCGGVPSLLPTLPLAYFIAPYPPDPLPGGKGENQSLFRRGLPPPAPPATGWEAALDLLWENGTFSFSGKVFHSGQGIQAAQVFPMPHGYKPDSKPTAEAAKPILQNLKSQPPSDTARKPQIRAPT